VTASTTLCPEAKCPIDEQQITIDGCCMVCHPVKGTFDLYVFHITLERIFALFTECEAIVSTENTVGVFSVVDPLLGLCKNTLPVEDFTECLGKCETKTRYIGKSMYLVLF
jgi:hypothetical protein